MVMTSNNAEQEFHEELERHSNLRTFSYPVLVRTEDGRELSIPLGRTFVHTELHDDSTGWDDPERDTPVNRTLNITSLGEIVGKGATNIGVIVTADGVPEEWKGVPLICKAHHTLETNHRPRNVVYELNQAYLVHKLGEAGLGPRYAGVTLQEIPNPSIGESPLRYWVAVMEYVGEIDLEDIRDMTFTPEEKNVLLQQLENFLYTVKGFTNGLGYDIGDYGIRVQREQGGNYRFYMIDVGFIKDPEAGIDVTRTISRYREFLRTSDADGNTTQDAGNL